MLPGLGDEREHFLAFVAIDPVRAADMEYTAPYVIIEGAYLVRNDSSLQGNDEVDRAGTRVVVGGGSAYDLFLTRELKAATLVRAPTSPEVTNVFLAASKAPPWRPRAPVGEAPVRDESRLMEHRQCAAAPCDFARQRGGPGSTRRPVPAGAAGPPTGRRHDPRARSRPAGLP
jgi:hypothetical protein